MNYNLILLKEGSNILVSNENIKYGDFFINNNGQISKCVKALEIWLIENLSTIKKVIAGIDTLPVLIYSDEVKQVLRDKYRWVEKIMDFSDWYDEQSWLPKVYDNSSKFDYELTIEDFKWNYMSSAFEAGFLQGKVHQSITNKMFSIADVKDIVTWMTKNYSSVEDELSKPFIDSASETNSDSLPDDFFDTAYNEAINRAIHSVLSKVKMIPVEVEIKDNNTIFVTKIL